MNETIYGLGNDEYHFGNEYREFLSSTQLKAYEKSPRYFKWKLDHPDDEKSDALVVGSLFHEMMAHYAENGYSIRSVNQWHFKLAVFIPPINETTGNPYGTNTKYYKDAYISFVEDNRECIICSADDYDMICSMGKSLLDECGETSDQVKKLLKWGKPEVSHFVEYEGCKFKYRPDLETKRKIIDWKTVSTNDLSERSINSIISKFGYDISAAFYLFMEHERTGIWKTFYWCFVSKQPPYDAVLVDASKWTYEYDSDTDIVIPQVGAIKMKKLLNLHIKCMQEQQWPGAEIFVPKDSFGRRIMTPAPPSWEVNNASSIIENSI